VLRRCGRRPPSPLAALFYPLRDRGLVGPGQDEEFRRTPADLLVESSLRTAERQSGLLGEEISADTAAGRGYLPQLRYALGGLLLSELARRPGVTPGYTGQLGGDDPVRLRMLPLGRDEFKTVGGFDRTILIGHAF
jgi:hypothetical protein